MTNFDIWYYQGTDGRAPEYAFLDADYVYAGDMEAASLRDLQQRVQMVAEDESPLANHRALKTGDVVRDARNRFWILTPQGIWASVQTFMGSVDKVSDQES